MKKRIKLLLSLSMLLFSMGGVNGYGSEALNYAQGSIQFGSFYTTESQVVAPEHPVLFDRQTIQATKGIEHTYDSGEFILKEPGVYRIVYSVSLDDDCEFWGSDPWRNVAITLDGQVIPGSEIFVGKNEHLGTIAFLVEICGKCPCHHVLRLVNNNDVTKGLHNIRLKAGSCGKDVTASFLIERIKHCSTDPCTCHH